MRILIALTLSLFFSGIAHAAKPPDFDTVQKDFCKIYTLIIAGNMAESLRDIKNLQKKLFQKKKLL